MLVFDHRTLKKYREVWGWTQEAMAHCLYITKRAYQLIESGHREPSGSQMVAIRRALRWSPSAEHITDMTDPLNAYEGWFVPVTEFPLEEYGHIPRIRKAWKRYNNPDISPHIGRQMWEKRMLLERERAGW